MKQRQYLILVAMLVMILVITVIFVVIPRHGLNAPPLSPQQSRWCECVHYILNRYQLDMNGGPSFVSAADMGAYLESRGFTRVYAPVHGVVTVFARSFGNGIDPTHGHVGVIESAHSGDGSTWLLVVRGARQGGAQVAEYGCSNVSNMTIPVAAGNGLIAYYTPPGTATLPTAEVAVSPPTETPVATLPVPRPALPTPTPMAIPTPEEILFGDEAVPEPTTAPEANMPMPDLSNTTTNLQHTWQEIIDPASDADTFFFAGEAGWSATIGVSSMDGKLDSYLALYDPAGREINDPYADDDRGGNGNALIERLVLPQSGRYRVVVRSWKGQSSGQYRLNLLLDPGTESPQRDVKPAETIEPVESVEPAKPSESAEPVEPPTPPSSSDSGPAAPHSTESSAHYLGAGHYRFIVHSGAGIRVSLDGEQVFDGLQAAPPASSETVVIYPEDRSHTVTIETYAAGDATETHFWWERMVQ